MAAFDLQTWYQIQYGSGSGLAIFIVETSVEVGGADTTQTNQQWQILQSPNWTSSNPTYLMRNRVGGPDSYLTVYCNTLSDCFSDTRVAMSQANYNLEQSLFQWELPQVGNSQQTYNLVNVANGTDEALTDSGDGIVRMTNDLNAINNTWVLEPLGTIQNETFLTFPSCTDPYTSSNTPCIRSSGLPGTTKGLIALAAIFASFLIIVSILWCWYRRATGRKIAQMQQHVANKPDVEGGLMVNDRSGRHHKFPNKVISTELGSKPITELGGPPGRHGVGVVELPVPEQREVDGRTMSRTFRNR